MSSVVALGGIMGSFGGFHLLDPLAGFVVGGMILKTAGEIADALEA